MNRPELPLRRVIRSVGCLIALTAAVPTHAAVVVDVDEITVNRPASGTLDVLLDVNVITTGLASDPDTAVTYNVTLDLDDADIFNDSSAGLEYLGVTNSLFSPSNLNDFGAVAPGVDIAVSDDVADADAAALVNPGVTTLFQLQFELSSTTPNNVFDINPSALTFLNELQELNGIDVPFTVTGGSITVVPEPTVIATGLMGLGLLGLSSRRVRR
jgi:hypothetical protein